MTDTIQDRLRDGADRFLKWAHKEQYSGPSVLSIPRHPANIDALLETAATHIDAQDAKIKALVEALIECRDDIDNYVRQEYPHDHPVQERCRQRDFASNPARIALAAAKETT